MPEDKKHFDVAPAGQIPVSHTSRPVIVGQQEAPAGDPMMRAAESEQSRPVADHKVTLQPIHPDTKSEAEPEQKAAPSSDTAPAQSSGPESVVAEALPPGQNPEIQKLVTDKTYKLPIKSSARKTMGVVVLGIIILVAVVAASAYLMMNR